MSNEDPFHQMITPNATPTEGGYCSWGYREGWWNEGPPPPTLEADQENPTRPTRARVEKAMKAKLLPQFIGNIQPDTQPGWGPYADYPC